MLNSSQKLSSVIPYTEILNSPQKLQIIQFNLSCCSLILLCFKPTTKERLANKKDVDSLFQHHRARCGALPVGALPASISFERVRRLSVTELTESDTYI